MEGVRVGAYDFLPSTGELRRDGKVITLQTQPAREPGQRAVRWHPFAREEIQTGTTDCR